ncbi:HAD hydrolase-like protein [Rhizobium sp. WYJ-E13]|uniref:HAD hydrolase-like protein n=1 Tax=Rhizobium sp. WYJ-E13 TaxID=2849093 RepID=UPI001C1ED5DF|nr:HAD hydrolase-like protein [Rhizobium sp. WYJ-E13]QWW72512.1 HAD hydrolase-like protein [Rhizobium sp. WYJ-E13]
MLGDINDAFVKMLKQLREFNVHFGFISNQRGMDASSHGRSESAALIRVLDELLRIRGGMPDFWMAWSELPLGTGAESQYRNDPRHKPGTGMILHAIERYGVERDNAVFVGTSVTSILAANDAGVMGIHYSGWRSNETPAKGLEMEARRLTSSPEITDVQRLRATIEQILELDRRRTA